MSNNSYYNDAWRIINEKNQNKISNYSMEFDGTSDVISVNNSSEALNVDFISISAWYYPTSFVSSSSIISSPNRGSGYHSYNIGLTSNGNLRVILYTGANFEQTFTSAGLLNLNQWNFVCMTYDGSNVTVTINTLSQSIARTGALQYTVNPTGNIEIGRRNGTSLLITGNLDQVSIFDYGLSASQVATLYGGGTAVTNPLSLSPKPIAAYQLGDQSAYSGANFLVPNNSLQDYVFQTSPSGGKRISIPSITITSAATISIWVNIIAFLGGTQQVIFGDQNTTKLVVNNQGGFVRVIYSGASGFGILITDLVTSDFINKWHHIALLQNGGAATVYINNINKGNVSGTLRTPSFVAIGGLANGGIATNGFVSNAAIFSTNLPATGTESIASLYNNGTPPDLTSYSNLERWYKLNAQDTFDGTNWTINDYIGSNDGTSVNMTSANLVQSNLQHTSGYSPYALNFDGTNQEFDIPSVSTLELYNTDFSISFWCKVDASATNPMFFEKYAGGGGWSLYVNTDRLRFYNGSVWTYISGAFQTVYAGLWTNVTVVGDLASTNLKCYINGNEVHSSTNTLIQIQNTSILTMAGSSGLSFSYAGGLSNVAIWSGTALSAAQVTEIYNSGVPISLNTFSGNKPNHWWQLGSNSSFNSNSWTCLDEGISSSISPLTSAVSTANMANDDIINGVGYTGNGLGASTIDILGDAPYSTANGLSENIDVLDRTTDVPPTV